MAYLINSPLGHLFVLVYARPSSASSVVRTSVAVIVVVAVGGTECKAVEHRRRAKQC